MNFKTISIISVLSISAAAFAAVVPAPTAVRDGAIPAEPTTVEETQVVEEPVAEAPVEQPQVEESSVPVEQTAPEAMTEPVAEPPAQPVEQSSQVVTPTPTAVRNASNPVSTYPTPTAVRRADANTVPPVTYYNTAYAPVQTVYVAGEPNGDTITLDELRGYVPFKVAFGVQGFLGSFALTDYDYYDDSFFDLSLRLGLTSILPLNKYTVAMKIGAIYEQSKATNTIYYFDRSANAEYSYHVSFKQRRVNFPVLFSFKSPRSNIMFDFGAQLSLAFYDKLHYSYNDGTKHEDTIDMIDEDYRNSLDWSLVLGMEFRVNKNVALNFRFDYGLNCLYNSFDGDYIIKVDELTSSAFLVGLTFYIQ